MPDLEAALALQSLLPAGWVAVVRDGSAVVGELAVRFGRGDAPLERRAEAERLRGDVERLESESAAAGKAFVAATTAAVAGRAALEAARADESRAAGQRRVAEEAERLAARMLEALMREAGWQEAQAERLTAEVARLRGAVDAPAAAATERETGTGADAATDDGAALATWEARVAELRAVRDRLAAEQASFDAAHREAEARRARAEATATMDEERIARAEREALALGERTRSLVAEREALGSELAVATERETAAASALTELRAADAASRDRLASAERDATAARERLRSADDRLRTADRADLEARLGRDSLREQLLVELAGLGELGLRRLRAEGESDDEAAKPVVADADETDADEGAALESALSSVADRWAAVAPASEAPTSGRLATLRRRYHELGAANPFAVDEYAELKTRLETLEAQQADLRAAIDRTRELITELNTMIADQFASTFRALESAFDRRFQQLFGGGYAHLLLTDPGDLSGTGIEIVARPPGKKQQALAMLSGGERALTAVALLFAMLEVRPVPFCVLDEVDAALDEANVDRFTSALRELAARTQFIVITHNRGTIEAADALYGVTVGDDSVSRVISLRLDEAQAIADGHRDGSMAGVS
jgi:chromosome segregation protein